MPDASASPSAINPLLPDAPGWTYGSVLPFARDPQGQLHWAVPEMLRQPINDLGVALQLPGAVASGRVPLAQARALVPQATVGLASAGLGLNPLLGEAGVGSLGVFAGRGAASADSSALARAMSMESQGADRDAIWNATGWYKDVDGKWKFEVPDSKARLNTEHLIPQADGAHRVPYQGTRLGDILHHPELFDAYPQMADTRVVNANNPAFNGYIANTPNGPVMGLAARPADDMLSTILHETQHLVQEHEGFARGGSVQDFLPDDFAKNYREEVQNINYYADRLRARGHDPDKIWSALNSYRIGKQPNSDALAAFNEASDDMPNTLDKLAQAHKRFKVLEFQRANAAMNYNRLQGEIEARMVQERHKWDLGEETPPWETPGDWPSDPLVRFDPMSDTAGLRASFKGYHGTPHTFEPVEHNPFGEFSNEAIGSGEGAQAYGWGHYIAGAKNVAEQYKSNLSNRDFINKVRDLYDETYGPEEAEELINESKSFTEPQKNLLQALKKDGWLGWDYPHQAVSAALKHPEDYDLSPETQKALDNLGSLYHIEIKPEEHELLDWDKPLSEQPKAVKDAFDSVNPVAKHTDNPDFHFHQWLRSKSAAKVLNDLGIPGLKYLDRLSRGADVNNPTRNYVIFDPSNIKIIGRNGDMLEPVEYNPFQEGESK